MQKIILEGKTILITGSAGFIGANHELITHTILAP
jgi:nucleoside-diphosphate-sugar epimerase